MNWLLLRGLSRQQRHWEGFPSDFESIVPGARVCCLDLPGTGTECARSSPATIAAITDDLRARWRTERAAGEQAWGLLGVSLAGMVAMHWVASWPRDFARVVLVNTSAGNLTPPWRRMDLRVLRDIVRAAMASDLEARERIALSFSSRLCPEPELVARRWAAYQREQPVRGATFLRQLLAATRFRAPEGIAVPALVVGSQGDVLAHPACAHALARHFRAPLRLHESAGHDLALDDPKWLASQVAEWVAAAPADCRPTT